MNLTRLSLLIGALVFLALPSAGTAQAPRRAATPLQAAARALIEGRYAEVDTLTEKLDTRDPNVVALRARAAIARGRYADAEASLRPVVSRFPTSEAALQLGLLMQMLGREFAPILDRVAMLSDTSSDPNEVARAGRALRALGRFREANAAYRDAGSAAPSDPAIQTAWGDLFLEKYNRPDALRSYQMALQVDARYVPALIGSARALSDDNPPQAIALAKRALEANPSSVEADVFLAEQAVDAGRRDEARDLLAKALEVNPSDLEAHALVAAIAFVDDKTQDFDAAVAKTLAIAPNYGDVYRTTGELAAHNYRFDEAVELTRKGLALDRNPRALADLGTHLLRTGDEAEARTALEASFKDDPYDKITFNLLAMLDTLDKFVTVRDGDVVMRLHKDEAPVLQEYAMSLTHRALDTFSKRYEFVPRGPILVEIFPKHDDFAVRNLGLPGLIGALGICFGRVVSMDSPRARPPGEFQWEATLWHELAHVITLQMSNQRVPRWLTEGISEYEEQRAHSEWRRDMDLDYAAALNRGGGIKLRDFNAAFQNPKLITLAYYQGSLIVEYLVSTYGDAGINKLLRTYGQGLDTDAALKTALNTDLDRMQAGFDQMLEKKFGDLRRALEVPDGVNDLMRTPTETLRTLAGEHAKSFPIQMALGRALRREGKLDDAMQAFERAAALIPNASGRDSPHEQMAAIALQNGRFSRSSRPG